MTRIVVLLLLLASCRPARECRGTITGPEMHRDTVTLRCK
jgi:hypothetical protein